MLETKNLDGTKTATPNKDPLTGAPGAHPLGVGVGAAAGGMAAGAAIGTVAGPLGTAVGAAVGAVVGGLAGKGIAESVDPTAEDAYWRENHASQEYASADRPYDDYAPAYRYGVSQYRDDLPFETAEPDLAEGWIAARGNSSLAWGEASHAARNAWDRLDTRNARPSLD